LKIALICLFTINRKKKNSNFNNNNTYLNSSSKIHWKFGTKSVNSLFLKSGNSTLSSTTQTLLPNIASQLKSNPSCSITVTGYPASTKASQSLCNQKANAAKAYL